MNFLISNNKRGAWDFQDKAIANITKDFKQNIAGRFLLVLPTGGGKTITAMRSVSNMIKSGMISKEDKVLWIVHTLSLYAHAKRYLDNRDNYSKFGLYDGLASVILVRMKAEAVRDLESGLKCKLIIIDEAHHAAASTYETFFDYPVGILGLTATPHRMDRRKLPFNKISYSITFRELVQRGVVLLPKFLPEVNTNITVEATSLQEEGQLERFNTEERNRLIAHYIFSETEKHKIKKIIVFAGTNAHVKSLYETIKKINNSSKNKVSHIGYIFGGDNNERDIPNDKYLDWHRTQQSSILITGLSLNNGYISWPR